MFQWKKWLLLSVFLTVAPTMASENDLPRHLLWMKYDQSVEDGTSIDRKVFGKTMSKVIFDWVILMDNLRIHRVEEDAQTKDLIDIVVKFEPLADRRAKAEVRIAAGQRSIIALNAEHTWTQDSLETTLRAAVGRLLGVDKRWLADLD